MVSLTLLGGGGRLTPLLLAACLCWSYLISANGFATPNSGPLRYDDLAGLLRNGSRGQFVQSSRGLERLWQDMPTYASKYLEYRWSQTEEELEQSEYPRDEMVEDTVEHARCILAGHLARFALEAGNLAQAQEYFAMSKGTKRIRVRNGLLQGDVHFALGNYTAAIDCYQDNISLGKDPTRMFEMMRGPVQDDVLFSKVALAYSKLGRSELAKKSWDYAAQLQLARGLYLEAIVSYLRMGDWKLAQGVVSEGLLALHYPTVATILQKGPPEDKLEEGEDSTLLENAVYSLIQGDYGTACHIFAKVSDDSPEKWGLVSILLRERQLDDVADCYSELRDDDPFALLKRGVLRKNVQAEKLWGALPVSVEEEETTEKKKEQAPPAAKEESKNVLDALFGYGRRSNNDESIQDTPQTLLLKAKETLHDFAAGTIDYLIAEYVGSSFISTSFHSQEEEDAFFQAMEERIAHLDQALANPMTLPTSVWVRATFCKINAELAIAERCNLNMANGRMLAAADPKKDGPTKAITSEAVWSSAGTILSYVPPKPVRNEPLRQKREAILDQCWGRLEEEGMSTSLVALVLARQGKSGALERRLVAEVFGNTSIPRLKTREAEAYEDLREGTGQRAEELFRQLADEPKEDDDDGESWSNRKQHYQSQLVSALEKQEKYKDAVEAMEALEASGYYEQQMGGPGYYLLQVGELYQKMGDLDMAEQKYRELSMIDRSLEWEGQWTVYGFVGLGDIALERGNLEEALAEFDRGIEVARNHLESIRGNKDDTGITTESNAISGLANAWMYSGDSLYEHGFSEEALTFYEECRAAAQTENEFWNNNFREGYDKRISVKIAQARLQLEQKMDQVAQEED